MEKWIRILTLFGLTLFSSLSVHARTQSKLPFAEIDREITQLFEADTASAMSVTIFDQDGILYSKGFGHSDLEKSKKIDPAKSQFRIDSISKIFTTSAVINLMERGFLSAETSIMDLDKVRFVQFLKVHDSKARLQQWKQIKIKHLLTHQAGISKDLPGARVFWNSSALADHAYPSFDKFHEGLLSMEFLFPAGQTEGAFKYSNLGMNLLARIVEDLNPEGLTFPRFVERYVFNPMGMKHSAYNFSAQNHPHLVTGYGVRQLDGQPLRIPHVFEVGSYDGSIGVATTTEDLARYGQQILRATHFLPNKIFTLNETARYFFTPPENNIFMTKGRAQAHGYFWRFRPLDKQEPQNLWVGHTGFGYGFESLLLVNPEHRIGAAIIANSSDSNPSFPAWDVLVAKLSAKKMQPVSSQTQKLLGEVTEKLIRSEGQVNFQQVKGQPATPEQLKKFAGQYFADNSIAGPVKEFVVEQDEQGQSHLYFVLRPDFRFRLEAEDLENGSFRFPKVADLLFNYEKVEFKINSSGQVTGVVLAQVKELAKFN